MAGRARILVIDDEAVVREFIARVLEREGYEVLTAADGNEGLDLLDANPDIDCITLDLMMPELDGLQLLEMLQVHDDPPPVLVLSAKGSREDVEVAITSGAHDYLVKPIDKDLLIERIETLLADEGVESSRRASARRHVNLRAAAPMQIVDISETGVCLKASFPLEKDAVVFLESDDLKIKLDLPANQRFTVRVANCRGSGNNWEIGARFVALPAEAARKIRQANQTGSWWKK